MLLAKISLSKVFAALGDANRLKLYKILIEEKEICVSSLADIVEISPAGASQHLKILEQAELIRRNRYGQKVCYTINTDNKHTEVINSLIEEE